MWTIEAFSPGCLGVNNQSIQSGINDFSALSWESVEVMFVLIINSSFWWGLKIDEVLPLRWAVSGRTPTYRPKVAYVTYYTSRVPLLTLPYCPRTLLEWWE